MLSLQLDPAHEPPGCLHAQAPEGFVVVTTPLFNNRETHMIDGPHQVRVCVLPSGCVGSPQLHKPWDPYVTLAAAALLALWASKAFLF